MDRGMEIRQGNRAFNGLLGQVIRNTVHTPVPESSTGKQKAETL